MEFIKCDKKFRIYRDKYPDRKRTPKPPISIRADKENTLKLPKPKYQVKKTIWQTLLERRTTRDYSNEPINIETLSTLLFYSLGVSGKEPAYGEVIPLRTFPTAGALNSIETIIQVNNVSGLEKGFYRYDYWFHALEKLKIGDHREAVFEASLEQEHTRDSALNLILVGYFDRTYWKYGERAYKYVHLDAGHASQNILLVAQALNLGACVVGAFYDEVLCKILDLDCEWRIPLLIITVGKKKN